MNAVKYCEARSNPISMNVWVANDNEGTYECQIL